MSIETDADRLSLLKSLGEQIEVEGRSVWAIFDNGYSELDFGVDSTSPQVTVRDRDIAGLPLDARVVIRGKKYTAVTRQPDGEGLTVLGLSEA